MEFCLFPCAALQDLEGTFPKAGLALGSIKFSLLGAPNLLRAWWFLLVFPWTLQDFGAGPGGPGIFGTSVVFPYKEFFLLSE